MGFDIKGAFASVVDNAADAATRQAISQAEGAFGIGAQLQPYAPPPTKAPPPVSPAANVAKEDAQPAPSMLRDLWGRYGKLALIILGVVGAGMLLFRSKRK